MRATGADSAVNRGSGYLGIDSGTLIRGIMEERPCAIWCRCSTVWDRERPIMPKLPAAPHKAPLAIDISEAPAEFITQLQQVTAKKQRLIVRRRGRAVAAVVPMRDLRLLEKMWEQLEDESDIEYARKMLADPTQTPRRLEEIRSRLGT